MRLAASRIFCTAGSKRPIRMAMIAMTTSNSMRVKAVRPRDRDGTGAMTHLRNDGDGSMKAQTLRRLEKDRGAGRTAEDGWAELPAGHGPAPNHSDRTTVVGDGVANLAKETDSKSCKTDLSI